MKKLIALGLALLAIGAVWLFTGGQDWTAPSFVHAETPIDYQPNQDMPEEVELFTARDGATIERFFYNQLSAEDQAIYRILRNGIASSDSGIQIDGNADDFDSIREIFQRVLWDYPEFFWATGSMEARLITRSDGHTYLILNPEYTHVEVAQESMQFTIDKAVNDFLATITNDMTEFEKVLAVYEYIILTTGYNLDAPDHQNIASVFIHGESVCAGLSKAAQLLLNRLGIFATYIVGDAFVGGSDEPLAHAWNLVRVDGEYYHLDVTWGIPSFTGESAVADQILILYDYFLVSDDLIVKTHRVAEGVIIPPATSLRNNFFVANGMFYEEVERSQILSVLQASIAADESSVALKLADRSLYEAAVALLVDGGLAIEAATPRSVELGLAGTRFSFRPKPNLNLITIYWVWDN